MRIHLRPHAALSACCIVKLHIFGIARLSTACLQNGAALLATDPPKLGPVPMDLSAAARALASGTQFGTTNDGVQLVRQIAKTCHDVSLKDHACKGTQHGDTGSLPCPDVDHLPQAYDIFGQTGPTMVLIHGESFSAFDGVSESSSGAALCMSGEGGNRLLEGVPGAPPCRGH